jgi:hypothetical protein
MASGATESESWLKRALAGRDQMGRDRGRSVKELRLDAGGRASLSRSLSSLGAVGIESLGEGGLQSHVALFSDAPGLVCPL